MAGDRAPARLGLCAMAFVLGIAGPATGSAANLDQPPVAAPAPEAHRLGKMIFAELVTPDLAAAERFYGSLFGWSFRDAAAGTLKYTEASLAGDAIAVIVQKPLPADARRGPAWLTFLSVRDLDAAVAQARLHGAKMLYGPHDALNGRGREAILADPQGAVFAMLASSAGDPPDYLAARGQWIWSSLLTKDPDVDAAFYQALFDYEVYEAPSDDRGQHLLLASGGYARASTNTLPPDRPDLHPRWIDYVRVDDATKTAAAVSALGGRVLVPPRIDRHGGKLAILADPQGAPFGVLEWPEAPTVQVQK